MVRHGVLTLALVASGACHKQAADPGPSCEQVVDHFLEVTKQGMTGHGDLELSNKKVMLAQCERRNYSKEARACLLAAKDIPGLGACRSLLVGDRPPTPPGLPPPPAPPAPPAGSAAGSGTPTP